MDCKTTTTVSDENYNTFTLRYEIEFNNIPPVSQVSFKTIEKAVEAAFSKALLKYKEN